MAKDLAEGVDSVVSNMYAFAARKSDGSVITWGRPDYGGDSSTVALDLRADKTNWVNSIVATCCAFAAHRNDGRVVTWGKIEQGGKGATLINDKFCPGEAEVVSGAAFFATSIVVYSMCCFFALSSAFTLSNV